VLKYLIFAIVSAPGVCWNVCSCPFVFNSLCTFCTMQSINLLAHFSYSLLAIRTWRKNYFLSV